MADCHRVGSAITVDPAALRLAPDLQNLWMVFVMELSVTRSAQLKTDICAALATFLKILGGFKATTESQGLEYSLTDYSNRIISLENVVTELSAANKLL